MTARQALKRVIQRSERTPPLGYRGAATMLELARHGPRPLASTRPAPDAPLHISAVIPSFRRGSGGHAIIVHLLENLRARGHRVSIYLEDSEGRHAAEPQAVTKRSFREFFGAEAIELQCDFDRWQGADVVLATGWQTVARALLLDGASARAYLVQDHEPDFYGVSVEALWAAQTYRQGLHCIAGSPWLAGVLRERYGAHASHYDMGVDQAVYGPGPGPGVAGAAGDLAPERMDDSRRDEDGSRRDDLVVFYARAITARRAVPLGLMALAELGMRRAGVEIALYGENRELDVPFAHRNLGVLSASELAALYREATVGLVLSLTNPSLAGIEMMACGLPCVELASESMLGSFGVDGPLLLAEPEPLALCTAIEQLLDDPSQRMRASRAGIELTAPRTWAAAADQVERGLRLAVSASVHS